MSRYSNRRFDPYYDPVYNAIHPDQLIVYDERRQVQLLRHTVSGHSRPRIDPSSLVIHIDGSCRDNGTAYSRAAYGIYFGPNSQFNLAGPLAPNQRQTSTRAEIEALVQALNVVEDLAQEDRILRHVKIVTDSSFLVNAMTDWMENWVRNGGIASTGRPVEHFHVLSGLNDRLEYLEHDFGVQCQLWFVRREENREADALARSVLA